MTIKLISKNQKTASFLPLNDQRRDSSQSTRPKYSMKILYHVAIGCVLVSACRLVPKENDDIAKLLQIAVAYDISGSSTQLPELTVTHLDQLAAYVQERGGTIGVCFFGKAVSLLPLLKLSPVKGPLDKRAEIASRNRQAIAEWKTRIAPYLGRRTSTHTDFNGALGRVASFFSEPQSFPTEKIAVFVSDGIHTVRNRSKRVLLPHDVQVFVIGMDKERARTVFSMRQVLLFNSIANALDALRPPTPN